MTYYFICFRIELNKTFNIYELCNIWQGVIYSRSFVPVAAMLRCRGWCRRCLYPRIYGERCMMIPHIYANDNKKWRYWNKKGTVLLWERYLFLLLYSGRYQRELCYSGRGDLYIDFLIWEFRYNLYIGLRSHYRTVLEDLPWMGDFPIYSVIGGGLPWFSHHTILV